METPLGTNGSESTLVTSVKIAKFEFSVAVYLSKCKTSGKSGNSLKKE